MKPQDPKPLTKGSGFRAMCEAGTTGQFRADMDSLLVTVGQRIRHFDTEGVWDSVFVEARTEGDGTLVVRVLVSNPDWDERLQIACIRSRPDDPDCLTALGTNLDHVPF